jgi:vitamin B12 transporter
MRLFIKLLLFILVTNTSYSQYTYENIPQITIQAFRTAEEHLPLTYSYDVIEPNDIKSSSSLNIIQSGPKQQFSSTFTRGTNSNHTLFTLNGIPIKDASTPTGSDDLTQHSFAGVSSLEIIKGPMSSVYGPDAIGGVVNMVTQPNDKNWIDLSYGSNNTWNEKIKLGQTIGKTIIDFQGENESSKNISVHPNGSEKDPYHFRNYTFQTQSLLDSGYYLKSNFINQTNHTNLDGLGEDTRNYTGLYKFSNQYLSLQNKDNELTINNTDHNRDYNKNGVKDTYDSNNKTLLTKTTIHTFADISVGSEHTFTHGKFDTNIDDYVSSVDKKRENHAYYTNAIKFLSDDFFVTAGGRYDMPSNFDNQLTERVGAYYNGFRTSVSTGYKMPTLYEMYGKDNYGFLGNSKLIPEESITYEVGYKNKIIDIALFQSDIKHLFVYKNNTYVNDTGISTRKGIETKLNYNISVIDFKNSNTFLIAEDSSGNELVRRPKWVNNLEASYNKIQNTSLKANWNYYGSHIDVDSVTYNNKIMPAVSTFDLSADYTLGNTILYGKLNNITDKTYQRPDGYSQLGRNFLIGFRQNF